MGNGNNIGLLCVDSLSRVSNTQQPCFHKDNNVLLNIF